MSQGKKTEHIIHKTRIKHRAVMGNSERFSVLWFPKCSATILGVVPTHCLEMALEAWTVFHFHCLQKIFFLPNWVTLISTQLEIKGNCSLDFEA